LFLFFFSETAWRTIFYQQIWRVSPLNQHLQPREERAPLRLRGPKLDTANVYIHTEQHTH
jgi:hypothetical protein